MQIARQIDIDLGNEVTKPRGLQPLYVVYHLLNTGRRWINIQFSTYIVSFTHISVYGSTSMSFCYKHILVKHEISKLKVGVYLKRC